MAWVGIVSGERTWVYLIAKKQLLSQILQPWLSQLILFASWSLGRFIFKCHCDVRKYRSGIKIKQDIDTVGAGLGMRTGTLLGIIIFV